MFWAIHDLLFADKENLTRPDLERDAQKLGLDLTKFKASLDNHAHKSVIDADAESARKVAVEGTPAIFINGKFFDATPSVNVLNMAVHDEVARVDELTKAGVSRDRVYETLMQSAKEKREGTAHPAEEEAAPASSAPADDRISPRASPRTTTR